MKQTRNESSKNDKTEDIFEVEELLSYCKEQGVDEKLHRYTELSYYNDHVKFSSLDEDKIKKMIKKVD